MNESKKAKTEEITNFDWLTGNWIRTNEIKGKQTYENWMRGIKNEYIGFGYTTEKNDTIWQENITLIKRDSVWNFEVFGKGESVPTIFKLSKIGKESFVCENDLNEFPKKIRYFRDKDKITAIISDSNTEIPFEFEKLKN